MGEVSSGRQALEGDPSRSFGTRNVKDPGSFFRPRATPNGAPTVDGRFAQSSGSDPVHFGEGPFLEESEMCATWGRWRAVRHDSRDLVRPVYENQLDSNLFHHIAKLLARASVPRMLGAIGMERLTALQKPKGRDPRHCRCGFGPKNFRPHYGPVVGTCN